MIHLLLECQREPASNGVERRARTNPRLASILPLPILVFLSVSALHAQGPSSLYGQVLVRFADGSDQNGAVTAASQRTEPLMAPELEPVIRALGTEIGVTLDLVQVSSGNWLVLEVNEPDLVDRAERQFTAHSAVAALERSTVPGDGTKAELLIRFAAGTTELAALERVVTGEEAVLGELATALGGTIPGVPLVVRVAGPDHVGLSVDLRALTMTIIEQLQSLPFVQAAQPNFSVGISL